MNDNRQSDSRVYRGEPRKDWWLLAKIMLVLIAGMAVVTGALQLLGVI